MVRTMGSSEGQPAQGNVRQNRGADTKSGAASLPEEQVPLIETAFQQGKEVIFPWKDGAERERIHAALSVLRDYLAGLKPEGSFEGIDKINADRQSFWVCSTGLGAPFHTDIADVLRFDGDAGGGRAGLEALGSSLVKDALQDIKAVLESALMRSAQAVGLPGDLTRDVTVRYRAIRYEALERDVAGIGLHPDGNVLSALVTDKRGLVVTDGAVTYEPSIDGAVIMPGSILYRWSGGRYKPTFHRVEVPRNTDTEDRTKVTVVGFLNFPDQAYMQPGTASGPSGQFFNDISRFKEDDMNKDGDLKLLWQSFHLS